MKPNTLIPCMLSTVCGTCPINVPGVENVDLTDLLLGHQDYLYKIGMILKQVRHCQPFKLTTNDLKIATKDDSSLETNCEATTGNHGQSSLISAALLSAPSESDDYYKDLQQVLDHVSDFEGKSDFRLL
jgi:hypothetical protein